MEVVNSFVQWQKDTFFSAAEEVQNSADAMASMYRMWLRKRNAGLHADLVQLQRELQMTLGTAKWQLEEFDRAVRESHTRWPGDQSSAKRHNQFIQAIAEQISRVEKELKESLVEEGKEPLRWVQLDEEERNDLALFLSASKVSDANSAPSSHDYTVKEEINEAFQRRDEQSLGAWKIMISGGESQEIKHSETRSQRFESVAKFAKFASKVKAKNSEDCPIKETTNSCSDLMGITRVSQRTKVSSERSGSCQGDFKENVISHLPEDHRQAPDHYMHLKRSARIAGLLAIAMLLFVSLVLYSS